MIGDFKFYEVGGKIRDELLGLTNKDVDYVAVPTEAVYSKIHPCEAQLSPARLMFKALKNYLEEQKFEIFLVTPECYTIRAKFPEGYKYQIPTLHGYHLITIGFDVQQFNQKLAIKNMDPIDIQKDNPTLLYYATV